MGWKEISPGREVSQLRDDGKLRREPMKTKVDLEIDLIERERESRRKKGERMRRVELR